MELVSLNIGRKFCQIILNKKRTKKTFQIKARKVKGHDYPGTFQQRQPNWFEEIKFIVGFVSVCYFFRVFFFKFSILN